MVLHRGFDTPSDFCLEPFGSHSVHMSRGQHHNHAMEVAHVAEALNNNGW